MSGFLCSMVGATFATAGRTAKTITTVGNAQVDTAQSKFGGSSALFDGTGDYLSIATNTDFGFGTGDFTIEGWFYKTTATTQWFIDTRTTTTQNSVAIQSNGSGSLRLFVNGSFVLTSSNTHTNNAWNHLAISRASGVTRFFINGVVSTNTYTDTTDYGATKPLVLGAQFNGTTAFNGYIDEFRVSNTARYTSAFTPSTTPFQNDSNTLLLIHADGTDASTVFTDDVGVRSPKGISAIGNTKVSTAQSKFGGASALFDGNGDYLSVATSADLTFAGNFTIECWYRTPDTTAALMPFWNTADHLFYIGQDGGPKYAVFQGGNNRLLSSVISISNNTWYHVAFVRNGSTLTAYHNGTSVGSVTYTTTVTTGNPNTLGQYTSFFWPGSAGSGYIDEFRISTTARYTAGFTAPTAAFTNDADTVLLIHADGTNNSTVFTDDNS